ncbi:MAG: response regulator transcription factor [Candidatus Sericytochromatia bacterium]|nr:response regulator transcription factor [Candidatus Sericytochromatia bacterium]
MSKHIAIVEDDDAIRRLIAFLLENEGYATTGYEDAAQARRGIAASRPDLLIIDLMLPDQDGLSLCRWARERPETARLPMITLTARDQTVDKYEAYKAGFDGYIVKPFDPLELIFKVQAFLRLVSASEEEVRAEFGPPEFRLSPARYVVAVEGHEVALTRLETALLAHLMQHPKEVFSAEELADSVLTAIKGQARSVDAVHAHVRNLRAKIESDPKHPRWLKTLGRRGYFFEG